MSRTVTETWTVRDVLAWTVGHFEKRGLSTPRLDAEILLASALGCDRLTLYVHHDRPLTEAERGAYRALVERRSAGTPAAYLLGEKEFYGRPFTVDPRVLIPRPETELLVDEVLAALLEDAQGEVLDLCSGSGCVGITLAAERPGLTVTAVDLSEDAATVAATNAERLGVAARYRQLVGDLFTPVGGRRFLSVTANPPYVAEAQLAGLQVEVREHEPRLALTTPGDGTEIARRVIDGAPAHLVPGGLLCLEHGEEQSAALVERAREHGGYAEVSTRRDLAGHLRIVVARTMV